jgi:hypothetical protein
MSRNRSLDRIAAALSTYGFVNIEPGQCVDERRLSSQPCAFIDLVVSERDDYW